MKERPILFSGDMVRAILDGRKTQTRRIVNAGFGISAQPVQEWNSPQEWFCPDGYYDSPENRVGNIIKCPYGQPGDRLWCREAFVDGYPHDPITDMPDCVDEDGNDKPLTVWYRATESELQWLDDDGFSVDNVPWKPSIHMPRKYCRLVLEVKAVRVERLQEIDETAIVSEGVDCDVFTPDRPDILQKKFKTLWNTLNAKRGYGWDQNPWVWVVEFEVCNG